MSHARRSVVVLFTVLVACGGSSSQQSSSTTPAAASSGGDAYPLADFTVLVTQQATPELCDAPDASLRACFAVDAAQCGELFGIAMTQCAHELEPQLPSTVDDSNAEAVSQQIATCAGTAYRLGLQQQGLLLSTPGCQ
jgi:hypothetical protein